MSIIMDRTGQVIRRSRNLAGLRDHARRFEVVSVEVKDTDGRNAEVYAEIKRTHGEYPNRRYEYLVTYTNGDIGRDFFADWRVAADFTANRRTWRSHTPATGGPQRALSVISEIPGFMARYDAARAPAVPKRALGRLPVRDDVDTLTYHRNPTRAEIKFGHGATHYADFTVEEACYEGTRIMKRWLVSPHDGLRYYR
jgi:hypothetical protein